MNKVKRRERKDVNKDIKEIKNDIKDLKLMMRCIMNILEELTVEDQA